jgi:hypothetical protein
MNTALATLAAISLVATPMYAANAAQTKTTTKATSSVAKQAKAEGESVKTEAKEIRHHAAAKHKYGTYRRCAPSHMASTHHKAAMHKTAAKKA